ncbi:hypothetical protein Esti_003653 [Eimeria stiedai]
MAELAEGTPAGGSDRHASLECTGHEEIQQRSDEGTDSYHPSRGGLQKETSPSIQTDLSGEENSSTSTLAAHRQFVMDQANVFVGDSVIAVQGPSAALRAECLEEDPPKDGEQVTKPTAELTCAAIDATTASSQKHKSVAAGQGDSIAPPADFLSDMPPPSLLPRQLRTKRAGVTKGASSRPPRVQAAATNSGADNAIETSSEEAGGQCAEHHAYWERGKMEGDAASSAAASAVPGDTAKADEEFLLFMKEIEQLDSQRQVDHADSQSAESAMPQVQLSQELKQISPSLDCPPAVLGTPETAQPQSAKKEAEQLDEQREARRSDWQAVIDSATGKTYYWDVTTDQVTWEIPRELSGEKTVDEAPSECQPSDLQQWAAATFKLTQELPTSGEKVQQLIFQLDFIEDELDAMYGGLASAKPERAPEKLDISSRLQRFRGLKRQREPNRPKRSRETKAACSDDELLKELIDLQLQQDRPQAPWQCPRCKRCNAEPRTQPQQTEIRSMASSLARRLGSVEKEWAAAMLAALKARLEDWIDGGLNGSFFLQRLEKMQQELQKHLSQESEAEGRKQELASAFPYSASAASVSASGTSKTSPRNCLASAVAAASSERIGAARHQAGSKSAAAASKPPQRPTPCSAPPTPAGPPPTLPDDVPPATAEGTHTEEATASAVDEGIRLADLVEAGSWYSAQSGVRAAAEGQFLGSLMSNIPLHQDGEITAATSRDGAQAPAAPVVTGKRSSGSIGSKKVTSSNPLVRKRMQLVERWQKSRQKDEESEEEDYEQRKERQKQRKIDEWKEREMARYGLECLHRDLAHFQIQAGLQGTPGGNCLCIRSRRGMNNANFIEVTADWRSLVGKKSLARGS